MSGKEHPDSYYTRSANPFPALPELDETLDADVCIVGGGYTGLSAALELAERGLSVVLLEANRIGWGASGRNGGQVCTGFSASLQRIEGWVGRADAKKLFAMAEEAKAIIRQRVADHAIDCDLTWGYYHAADREREMRDVEAWAEQLARHYDYHGAEVVRGREASRRFVDSPRYVGGLFDAHAGHLHPLNYCLGLGRAALAAGAKLYEGSRVVRIMRGPRPVVETAHGRVRAGHVVLACNAYLDGLVPELRRKIMPVGTYIGATEVLGEASAQALIPQDHAVCDMKFVLSYFRRSRDHRLLFGGLVSYSTLPPPNLKAAVRRAMLKVFPQLSHVTFDYAWGGYVAITMERSPHLGRLDGNLYFAQGYSGTGVTLSAIAARVIAEAVAGQAGRLDVFAKLPHTTFPGGRLLRTPTLALAMLWFRLRDLRP